MVQKVECISCGVKILANTHEHNAGYCGKCYKEELRKDALKKANLDEAEAMTIADEFCVDLKGRKLGTAFAVFELAYEKANIVGSRWRVFPKEEKHDPNICIDSRPPILSILIDDSTREVISVEK